MVVIIALLATIGASLMSFGLLANNRGKIHLSQESLTNSRIEHEENKSITSSFLPTEQKAHDFENGEHKIIIFVTCGILLFLVTLGFCLFFWGCCGFGGCRKCKRTRGQDFYREQFYANLRQVNNGAELIQMTSTMTSTEHDRYEYYKRHYYANKVHINKENSQNTNNDTNHQYETPQFEDNSTIQQYETLQYEDEIEEMPRLPVATEMVLPIPTQMVQLPVATQTEDTKQKYTVIEMNSTEHHTGLIDATKDFVWYKLSHDTDGADDTEDTDDT